MTYNDRIIHERMAAGVKAAARQSIAKRKKRRRWPWVLLLGVLVVLALAHKDEKTVAQNISSENRPCPANSADVGWSNLSPECKQKSLQEFRRGAQEMEDCLQGASLGSPLWVMCNRKLLPGIITEDEIEHGMRIHAASLACQQQFPPGPRWAACMNDLLDKK